MNRAKRTSKIGIIITIIVLIIIVTVSNIKVNDVSGVETGLGVIVMPIQNGEKMFFLTKMIFFQC